MQPLNGVQQAGVDRAQRIAQMLEQRHIQVEMAAAAFAREDRRHAQEVARPAESDRSHADEREAHGDGQPGPGGERRERRDQPPDPPEGGSGRRVDLTA
jgi:hypothetical protein